MISTGRVLSFDQVSKSEVVLLWAELFRYEASLSLESRVVTDPGPILQTVVGTLTDGPGAVWVAHAEKEPAGFLAITPGAYIGTRACGFMVLGAYVPPLFRGEGVLSSLFFALRGFCRERGVESVQFAVAEGNALMGPLGRRHARTVGIVYEKRVL